jgi:hypothetical protein
VKLALLPGRRNPGAMAGTWGIVFGLYLWWGSHAVGLGSNQAIILGIVGGAASAFFVYLRGAGASRSPAEQPGVFLGRAVAKRSRGNDPTSS